MWNKTFVYDFEVFAYDWLCVYKYTETGQKFRFHNDPDGLRNFLDPELWFVGFNNKGYDKWLVKGIMAGCSPEEVKSINDWIIKEGQPGWTAPVLNYKKLVKFIDIDLMDDTQEGTSLKSFEAHSGMNITESSVPFDLDRPLTDEEIAETFKYCEADVDATEALLQIRKEYIDTKIYLAELKELNVNECVQLTNARFTAAFLEAVKTERIEPLVYTVPNNLDVGVIPAEILDFFRQIIADTGENSKQKQYSFSIGDCSVKIGLGGIHGSIDHLMYQASKGDGLITENVDVGSFYPHLQTICGYASRNMRDPNEYADVLERRMKAKKAGDKKKANAYKLILNTTFGATLQSTNPLYDLLQGRHVCISGQLYILDLAFNLYKTVKDLIIIQLNTDGIAIQYPEGEEQKVKEIIAEWCERTKFTMETDRIRAMYQRDVNDYIEVQENGEIKLKGGAVVRGISTAGAFKINNTATVVADAIVRYFVDGVPPEQTILADTNILHYQFIAKASHKYDGVVWLHEGEQIPVQRCNRVYASANLADGTLYKTSGSSLTKIASLPEHCIIDNANERYFADIDVLWYIRKAYEEINNFKGEKNMATTKKAEGVSETPKTTEIAEKMKKAEPMTLLRKLMAIRKDFRSASVKKSGWNQHGGYDYYDLPDIVIPATEILEKYNTIFTILFTDGTAIGTLHDLDSESVEVFEFPIVKISEPAKFRMNEVQALGAEMTYMRRYLYYLLLDITNKDEFDSAKPATTPATISSMKAPDPNATKAEAKKIVAGEAKPAGQVELDAVTEGLLKLANVNKESAQEISNAIKKKNPFTKKDATDALKLIKTCLNQAEGGKKDAD